MKPAINEASRGPGNEPSGVRLVHSNCDGSFTVGTFLVPISTPLLGFLLLIWPHCHTTCLFHCQANYWLQVTYWLPCQIPPPPCCLAASHFSVERRKSLLNHLTRTLNPGRGPFLFGDDFLKGLHRKGKMPAQQLFSGSSNSNFRRSVSLKP